MRESDFAKRAAAALLHRERVEDSEDPEVLDLASRSLTEIARMSCELDGLGLAKGSSVRDIATRAIDSATLGDLVALTAGRSVSVGYDAEPRPYADMFQETSAQNFRTIHRVKLSDSPDLELVPEGNDYPSHTISDTGETFAIDTYGSILEFTFQAIINDDLEALTRIPQMHGAAAASKENKVVWDVFAANAAMSDTREIFNATDGNLALSSPLDVAAIEAARQYFLGAATEQSRVLNLVPRYLIVGTDLVTTAEKILRTPSDFGGHADIADALSESLRSALTLVVEPRIPTGEWFMASQFNRVWTAQYAWLSGSRGVVLDRDVKFESGAIRFKASDHFGFGVLDRRGLYKGTAAAS